MFTDPNILGFMVHYSFKLSNKNSFQIAKTHTTTKEGNPQ